ncbi:MAG: hypothetical protein KF718_24690 [Polyangiaceae bacterium]|nr:hypothetical protein [Polyangiaceae bacterium]
MGVEAGRAGCSWSSRGVVWIVLAGAVTAAAAPVGCNGDDDARNAPAPFCEKQPAGSVHNVTVGCDQRCPGDPGCPAGGDPTFYAGAAVEDVTPVVDHIVVWAPGNEDGYQFNPLAGDKCVKKGSCDLTDYASCEAVDPMKCTWIAGFGAARPADDVADPTTVRCVVMKQGHTKVGLCAVDNVGWFYNEVEQTRELLAADHPEVDLDFLMVASTHVHETQDTLGIWGPSDAQSGVKPEYNALFRKKTAEALARANAELRPVRLEFGRTLVDGHIAGTDPGGHKTAAFVSDTRDPVVIDSELRTIRFVAQADDATVATLINFTSHPEFAGSRQRLTSSDFTHTLREGVEKGLSVKSSTGDTLMERPGFGGVAIFINGALGGQVGPGVVRHVDFEGNEVPHGIERGYNNGRLLAVYAHEAMTVGVEVAETAPLGFRARELYADVHNTAYHIAIAQQLFERAGYFYDPTRPLGDDNIPAVRTQIAVIDVGPAEMVSLPGELHAELLLATPEGVTSLDSPFPFTPAPFVVLNDPATNPNCQTDGYSRCNDGPPDIAALDRTRVLDLHRDPKARFRWVLGLGQDQIGYILPAYDYKLHPQNPYFSEYTPGEHYEETNSVGPNVESAVIDPLLQLLGSPPVVRRKD